MKQIKCILAVLAVMCLCMSAVVLCFAQTEKPDIADKTNVIVQAEGTVSSTGWASPAVQATYEGGIFRATPASGVSACFELNTSLTGDKSGLTTFTTFVLERGAQDGWYQWIFRGSEAASDFAALKIYPNGAVGFWSRKAGVLLDIDTSLGGTAAYTPIFVNTPEYFGEGFMTKSGDRVKIEILSEPASVSVWMSYWDGAAFGESKLIVDSLEMPQMNANAAPFWFGNITDNTYSEIVMCDVNETPASELPSVEGKENLVTIAAGEIPETGGFGGGSAIYSEGGLLTGSGGANAKYTIPSSLTDIAQVEIVSDGQVKTISGNDLRVYNEVVMWPDEGSTHTLNFSPRSNSSTGANVIVRVGINKSGSAHGYNVFIEDRADGGAFNRKYMISDIRTVLGEDYDLSDTTGLQRVKLYTVTQADKLWLWISYSANGGETYTEPKLVYNGVEIVNTTPHTAVFFLDSGSGVYSAFKTISLDEFTSMAFPDTEGMENLVTIAPGEIKESGGFGGGSATYGEDGLLTGSGGANAKYTIPSGLTDVGTAEIIADDGEIKTISGTELRVYNEVVMWPDEGSTHTLNFSPRSNSSTGANVIVRVGINKSGSAHGYNVFIEDRADAGTFNRKYMITDVRTILGDDYDLSDTTGLQRVKLYTVTQADKLWLWMSYSADGGETYTQPRMIYDGVQIVETTPHTAVFFLDSGSGVYSEFKTICLDELAPPYEEGDQGTYPETPEKPPVNDEQIKPELPERGFDPIWLAVIIPAAVIVCGGAAAVIIIVKKKGAKKNHEENN